MITGFEKRTQELSNEEKRIANHLFSVFTGFAKFRTSGLIIKELERVFGIELKPVRLRKIIHYMRTDLCRDGFIIATSKGYKYSNDSKELNEYKTSLDQRINSQLEIWNGLAKIIRGNK